MPYVHWDYFLSLVEDLEHTGRYVEISRENFSTFSVEFSRIILAAGSEIDVVAKMLYPTSAPVIKRPTIADHQKVLAAEYPLLWSTEVEVPKHGHTFVPWQSWNSGKPPDWWLAYNDVKHQRNVHYAKANLENALNSVAGLCVMVTYLHLEDLESSKIKNVPRFINLHRRYHYSTKMEGREMFCPPDFEPPRIQGPPGGIKHIPLRRK